MNKNSALRAATVLSFLAISLLATACNTVAGAGKDTSAAGHAVTHAAEEAKP
jgi:predicted small secreted protein